MMHASSAAARGKDTAWTRWLNMSGEGYGRLSAGAELAFGAEPVVELRPAAVLPNEVGALRDGVAGDRLGRAGGHGGGYLGNGGIANFRANRCSGNGSGRCFDLLGHGTPSRIFLQTPRHHPCGG